MECEHCKKREAITVVGGRKVCEVCARNEILKRIRRDAISKKTFSYKERVLITIPDFLKTEGDLLKALLMKACYSCKLEGEVLEVTTNDQNGIVEKLWKVLRLSMNPSHNIRKVVLPFTADFLMAYIIYAVSTKEKDYVWLLNYKHEINGVTFVMPFFSTSQKELSGYFTHELVTGDPLFDSILKWEEGNLGENYELFHAYWNSGKILQGEKHCSFCGAYIRDGEACQRCSQLTTSRL
ncbi:hypothetical protein [Sulfuracidifex tepidarius]|uniref:Uncharacterized protein n=1 Tax=Sulfuracidifex tepidarius TaxID=1294262 RepID=A0A510E263_9CREN|nr:hypothetical protein [Sulfuracidifex tepidarius]BBG23838.1 hypothetical protein IC006_1133 [Sulfuracidifex tepidarius]BBG26593.1 hypothetical protein IC007_1108 [Sulfuracidifex tepidarius]